MNNATVPERKVVGTQGNVSCYIDKAVTVLRAENGLHLVAANPRIGMEAHFHKGVTVARGCITNMHFYGVDVGELGQKLNFNVTVYEKTVNGGKVYTYLDLHRVAGDSTHTLEFKTNKLEMREGDIIIAGTDALIRFREVTAVGIAA